MTHNRYARGNKAWGECGRSGRRMLLKDMVFDGQYPNMRVDPSWYEPKHPLEHMPKIEDAVGLYRPAPENLPGPRAPVLSGVLIGTAADLTWTASFDPVSLIDLYMLYRAVDSGEYELLATIDLERDEFGGVLTTLEYEDTGLLSETVYHYYVVAQNKKGQQSAASNVVDLTPVGGPVLYVTGSEQRPSVVAGSEMTFTLTTANVTDNTTYPRALLTIAIAVRSGSITTASAPASITIDGQPMAIRFQSADPGIFSGQQYLVVATARIPVGGFGEGRVVINWPSIPSDAPTVAITAMAFYNVSNSSLDFAEGYISANQTKNNPSDPLSVAAGGAIFGANVQYTANDFDASIWVIDGDFRTITMQTPDVQIGEGHFFMTGYELYSEAKTEYLYSNSETGEVPFLPVIAFVMRGTYGETPDSSLGIAQETDFARSVGKSKIKAIGLAEETDTALSVTAEFTTVGGSIFAYIIGTDNGIWVSYDGQAGSFTKQLAFTTTGPVNIASSTQPMAVAVLDKVGLVGGSTVMNNFAYSVDAWDWTAGMMGPITQPTGTTYRRFHPQAVAYSDDLELWVAVGSAVISDSVGSTISSVASTARSTDGISWTETEVPSTTQSNDFQNLLSVEWCSSIGKFVAVGNYFNGTDQAPRLVSSSDGINWTIATNPSSSTGSINAVAWAPSLGYAIAVGSTGSAALVWKTTDGTTWTTVTPTGTALPTVPVTIRWLPSANKFFLSGTATNTQRTSADGTSWGSNISINPSNSVYGIDYSPDIGRYVCAIGNSSGSFYYTTNGVTLSGWNGFGQTVGVTRGNRSVIWAP